MWAFSGLAHSADALRRWHINIATEAVVRAPADGYTLLLGFWPTRRTRSTPRSTKNWTSISCATSRELRASQASPLSSWSTHRFGSRPFPNSSPMSKPIRVRSRWRRFSVRPAVAPTKLEDLKQRDQQLEPLRAEQRKAIEKRCAAQARDRIRSATSGANSINKSSTQLWLTLDP